MRRIYEAAAYAPQPGNFWPGTVSPPVWPRLETDTRTEIAIIGGGFTGLSAALSLAQAGRRVTLLEAERPGFGASTRNGGFCCLGGAKASNTRLRRLFGTDAPQAWAQTERAAISYAEELIAQHSLTVDRHSSGETLLAHRPRAFAALQASAEETGALYGVTPQILPREALPQHGLGGPWHGAMTLPLGFALNPARYHAGLAKAAHAAGASLHAHSPVQRLTRSGQWQIQTPRARITADTVLLATNGYSSEDLPDWLGARYLPVQSSVLVTRPLTPQEQAAQGWTSAQMAYDTRVLLHYFRLMPDGRFLFGMRGGLRATPSEQEAVSRRIRADFARMFPAWAGVDIPHAWSGLACLTRPLVPFAGPVPRVEGLFAAFGYHGNGVAMAPYLGAAAAAQIAGQKAPGPVPDWLGAAPRRFPLGRHRRMLLRPAYKAAELLDL